MRVRAFFNSSPDVGRRKDPSLVATYKALSTKFTLLILPSAPTT
jgi:hypothetical protein